MAKYEEMKGVRDLNNRIYVTHEKGKTKVKLVYNTSFVTTSTINENMVDVLKQLTNINDYLPMIFGWVDWKKITKKFNNFDTWVIEFFNYGNVNNNGNFCVSLYAKRGKKEINDGFSSHSGIAIGQYELNDNIYKFLEYADKYLK